MADARAGERLEAAGSRAARNAGRRFFGTPFSRSALFARGLGALYEMLGELSKVRGRADGDLGSQRAG